jgi:hypothetical protein
MKHQKARRNPQRPLQSYVNPEERKAITDRARRYNLSISAFIRAACLGLDLGPAIDEINFVRTHRQQGSLH